MQRTTSMIGSLRRLIIGAPIPSSKAHHERLSPFLGLPVFSSDALSSVAYATEAILFVLVTAPTAPLGYMLPITVGICLLIVIVATSYQQTIHAYPGGGGSYIVASENLGETPGLLAGAALLIDYVLTVSVSIAAGVAAMVSAYPQLHYLLVPLSLGCILVVAWANLRGVRESGAAFAIPTYGFLFFMTIMLIFGLTKVIGHAPPIQHIITEPETIGLDKAPMLFLVLRAFAAGCTALTGVEAVSNGVPAFKAPEQDNAAKTLRWMATILVVLFLGTGIMAHYLPELVLYTETSRPEYKTVVSQIAAHVFGGASLLYYCVQYATAAILVLAANTSFADFPRLSSLMARDGYLPRPFARQGDRLVFQNGIVLLAIAAGLLVWHFKGELDQLLPLYAVGVFMAFTLSQFGMVQHWRKLRDKGWKWRATVNGVGAVITAIVTLVIFGTKFVEGAWIVAVLLLILFGVFKAIKARYTSISRQLEITEEWQATQRHNHVLLLVPRVHFGILDALEYARTLGIECRAMHVTIDDRNVPTIRAAWERYGGDTPLVILKSPFRSLIAPILEYVDQTLEENPDRIVTVIVPEAVPSKWYHKFLQENVGMQLKMALASRKNVVVTNVRYFLD